MDENPQFFAPVLIASVSHAYACSWRAFRRSGGGWISADGFHASGQGYTVIARLFDDADRRIGSFLTP